MRLVKHGLALAVAVSILFCMNTTAFAETLDEILNNSETSSVSSSVDGSNNQGADTQGSDNRTESNRTNSNNPLYDAEKQKENRESLVGALSGAADMSEPVEGVQEATVALQKVVSMIVQFLMYAITLFLTLRVVLDIGYIVLPIFRPFLDGGASAGMAAGGAAAGGMNNSYGGYNTNGYNSGYNSGYNNGYNNRYNNNGYNTQGTMQQGAVPGIFSGRQLVSDAAITAVTQTPLDQNGKKKSALMIYAHDMMVTLIIVPILLLMAVTGILTSVGLMLGQAICNAISGMSFMQG